MSVDVSYVEEAIGCLGHLVYRDPRLRAQVQPVGQSLVALALADGSFSVKTAYLVVRVVDVRVTRLSHQRQASYLAVTGCCVAQLQSLVDRMLELDTKPDVACLNAILRAAGATGAVDHVEEIFQQLRHNVSQPSLCSRSILCL